MKNIAKAIVETSKSIKGIEKNLTVGTGSYSYNGVSDKDVKNIVGKAMQENGLCIVPIEVTPTTTVERWTETYNNQEKQKQQVFTEVKTKYLLLHESGESIEIAGYGHGVDNQDKAAGKATTYALKYAMLYIFQVATGAIDDSDSTHSNNHEVPQQQNNNLPWLNEGTQEWDNVVSALLANKCDMKYVASKFKVSKTSKTKLEQLIKK